MPAARTAAPARHPRSELQAWYVAGLHPKLAAAVRAGAVSATAAESLDRLVRELLELPEERRREAA